MQHIILIGGLLWQAIKLLARGDKMKKLILLIAFLLMLIPLRSSAIPPFPGAEGLGATDDNIGGRGGTLYVVTTLGGAGSGSLREACEASGARYVTFAVSGIINLGSSIIITNDNITIAGETSPGGICVAGYPFIVRCGEAIIRHMRFRLGSENGMGDNDAADVWGAASGFPGSSCVATRKNIIWDHCSFSWGTDETFTLSAVPQYVTVSWCIISEGLDANNHGFGLSVSGKFNEICQSTDNKVSLHHNYIAHHRLRVPQLTTTDALSAYPVQVDARNNIIYNWLDHNLPFIYGSSKVNFVSNYVKAGPDSDAYGDCAYFATIDENGAGAQSPVDTLYVNGNVLFGGTATGWGVDDFDVGGCSTAGTDAQAESAWDFGGVAVTTTAMDAAYALTVLADVGATIPSRDSVDTATVADFAAGTGAIIDDVTWPGSWPTYSTPSPPTDSDNDGMADIWEMATFGDLDQGSNDDFDADGYRDIEEYFHFLAAGGDPNTPVIVLTGTLSDGATEAQIVAGSQTLIGTITNDTLVATFGDDNQFTTDFIAGLDSGGAEAAGWDAVVKANLVYTDISRDSATQFTVTLGAEATYAITTPETITCTVPANCLTGAVQIIATPTFEITASNPACTMAGSLSDGATEAQIVTGSETLVGTITDTELVATFGDDVQATTDFIALIDSAQSEAGGWDAQVKANLDYTMISRDSATQWTLTTPAAASFDVSANETITVKLPTTATTSGVEITCTPQVNIVFFDTSTEEITGMTLQ